MNKFVSINNNLNSIFSDIFYIVHQSINKFNNNEILIYTLLFCINNIYFLNKLIDLISLLVNSNYDNIIKLKKIEKKIETTDIKIINIYNSINQHNKKNDKLLIPIIQNVQNKIYSIDNNLDLYDLNDIEKSIIHPEVERLMANKDNSNFINNSNYLGLKKINIGYNNYYNLHSYKHVDEQLPFNMLLYISEIDQIIIKIGNKRKYKYVNSKLSTVYCSKMEENKNKSILCNNNIKSNNKKCYNYNCKYYHDYFVGYSDNYDKIRSFSNNPIVYNCYNFKDGNYVKENIKKINWHDALNIYQSSLSNILIACLHSQE